MRNNLTNQGVESPDACPLSGGATVAASGASGCVVSMPGPSVPGIAAYVPRAEGVAAAVAKRVLDRHRAAQAEAAESSGQGVLAPDIDPHAPSGHVHVRKYSPANWFSQSGVLKKRREIENKGLPSFDKWRFITLTIDPNNFESPFAAYESGKRRMPAFLKECRTSGLWSSSAKWCWKLEFQENGWPHWHLLVERREKMSESEMVRLAKVWKIGRTNIEMVRGDDFLYSFKYAFKPVAVVDESGDGFDDLDMLPAPAWFLDHYVPGVDGCKPASFARVRFWQTSRHFYTGAAAPAAPATKPTRSILPVPVRQVVEGIQGAVQVVARGAVGSYAKSAVFVLTCSMGYFSTLAGWHTLGDNAAIMAVHSYVVPVAAIQQNTNKHILWQLHQLTQLNRLTLRTAQRLSRENRNLNHC